MTAADIIFDALWNPDTFREVIEDASANHPELRDDIERIAEGMFPGFILKRSDVESPE